MLSKDFKFMGDMGAFLFLYVVKEQVPDYEEWRARVKPKRAPSPPQAPGGRGTARAAAGRTRS